MERGPGCAGPVHGERTAGTAAGDGAGGTVGADAPRAGLVKVKIATRTLRSGGRDVRGLFGARARPVLWGWAAELAAPWTERAALATPRAAIGGGGSPSGRRWRRVGLVGSQNATRTLGPVCRAVLWNAGRRDLVEVGSGRRRDGSAQGVGEAGARPGDGRTPEVGRGGGQTPARQNRATTLWDAARCRDWGCGA